MFLKMHICGKLLRRASFKKFYRLLSSRRFEANKHAEKEIWDEPKGHDTGLLVYNTLTKTKTKLILQNDYIVKWYSCGPTVYDSAHIGHASCYVKLDIIRRILVDVFNYNVFYLMGITDIDDKIITRSNELKIDFKSLASKYEDEFHSDLEALNVLPPTMTVKVSNHIPEIITFVSELLDKGLAYKAPSGSVYFSVHKFPGYGKLYPPQSSENPEKPNPEKQSPLDFTLWKAAKRGEPSWDSPWGPGRPGWHIECSAMASKVLGSRLDIHSGGQDLIFPHHENEEAQSCAFHGTSQWVNYWLHTGHLIVKGDVKMSKSLKNTISISQLLSSYTSNQFRMLCLLSPYRNNIEYSPESMSTATSMCRRIESFLDECEIWLSGVKPTTTIDNSVVFKHIQDTKSAIKNHLRDDFDTYKAVESILQFVSIINLMLNKPSMETESSKEGTVGVIAASNFVKQTLIMLGFTFDSAKGDRGEGKYLSPVLDAALQLRSSVREVALHEDMAEVKSQRLRLLEACDSMRATLSGAGIEIKDHKSQKSTWTLKDVVTPNKEI